MPDLAFSKGDASKAAGLEYNDVKILLIVAEILYWIFYVCGRLFIKNIE